MTNTTQLPNVAQNTSQQQNIRAIFEALRIPFRPDQIKERVAWTNKQGQPQYARYVEWFTVAERLDEVYPEWTYEIESIEYSGDQICIIRAAITIAGVRRMGAGTGPSYTETGIKKAESDALKRAARMFGIARELYTDDAPDTQQQSAPRSFEQVEQRANQQYQQNVQAPAQQPRQEHGAGQRTAANPMYQQQPPPQQQVYTQNPSNGQQPAPQQQRQAGGFPQNCLAQSPEDLITPRQLVAVRAIANSSGLEAETEIQRLTGCNLLNISRRAASAFIDHLKKGPQTNSAVQQSTYQPQPQVYQAQGINFQALVQPQGNNQREWSPESQPLEQVEAWEEAIIPQGCGKRSGAVLGLILASELWWLCTKWQPQPGNAVHQEFAQLLASVPDSAYARQS